MKNKPLLIVTLYASLMVGLLGINSLSTYLKNKRLETERKQRIMEIMETPNTISRKSEDVLDLTNYEFEMQGFRNNPLKYPIKREIQNTLPPWSRNSIVYENYSASFQKSVDMLESDLEKMFVNETYDNISNALLIKYIDDVCAIHDKVNPFFAENNDHFKLKYSLNVDKNTPQKVIRDGKKIFFYITGKEYPHPIVFEEIENPLFMGINDGSTTKIDSGMPYSLNILTLNHEEGHTAYNTTENIYEMIMATRNSKTLNECAAYLFSRAGAEIIKPHLIEENIDMTSQLESLMDSQRTAMMYCHQFFEEAHFSGYALAEALLTHHNQNITNAFNNLDGITSFSQLPEEVINIYESYRIPITENDKTFSKFSELSAKLDLLTNNLVKEAKEREIKTKHNLDLLCINSALFTWSLRTPDNNDSRYELH